MESTLASPPEDAFVQRDAGADEDPPALMLDERGMICDCNRAGERLFGYRRSEVVWHHVSMLLPQMENVDLVTGGEVNPRLRYLCRIGRRFDTCNCRGEHFDSALFVNDLGNPGPHRLRMIVRAAGPSDGQRQVV